jgi:hypothetical protein
MEPVLGEPLLRRLDLHVNRLGPRQLIVPYENTRGRASRIAVAALVCPSLVSIKVGGSDDTEAKVYFRRVRSVDA